MRKYLILIFFMASTASAKQVDLKESIVIGGIKQWITVKGDSEKPLLLFLHGGPGNSVISYAHRFTDRLSDHFLTVHWDQRESGETAILNSSDQALTVSLITSDAVELIQHLRTRFGKPKIYLMGQSWGGFLALQVAITAPELLEACLAVSPMIHQVESEQLSLTRMLELSKKKNDTLAIRELMKVQIPFASTNDLYLHRKWIATFDGRKPAAYSFVEAWCKVWFPLFAEASLVDIPTQAPELKCPVYFFVGRKDYQTHYQLTENYFRKVKAPVKRLFWFENSSHSPHMTESKKFQELVKSVLQN